jgi:hypothetical protein
MQRPGPVDVRPLFAPLGHELVALLRSLDAVGWQRMATSRWTVRDVASHLLDGAVRRLSIQRDGHLVPFEGTDLAAFLHELNATWTRAAERLSPRVLTDLHESADRSTFPVAWAGVDGDTMWLDLGREYTERWHHQEQIRRAVGAPALDGAQWTDAALAVAVRALPRAWAPLDAPPGAHVAVRVGPHAWSLRREEAGWALYEGDAADADAVIACDVMTTLHVWHKLLTPEQAAPHVRVSGDARLAAPFTDVVALMA